MTGRRKKITETAEAVTPIAETRYRDVYHSLEDRPAVILSDGTQCWYRLGVLHRDKGPAIIRPDGTEEYWYRGRPSGPR